MQTSDSTDLELIQAGNSMGQRGNAIVARQRKMSHVGELLHGLRVVQQPPLSFIGLTLPLRGLITVQHNLLQFLQPCYGVKVLICDGELYALQAQHLQSPNQLY